MSVDLHRFRHVVRQARGSREPLQAADLFERALSIWRGEPFAALDTPWINGLRSTLPGERLAVVLDRNDVAFRVGRHSEVLVELTAAHAAHPLDERLAGQLMLAQYRGGRQANALDTYRQMRQRLADELGVDPGASLDRVHQQILSGDEQPPGRALPPHLVPDRPHSALLRRATSFVGHKHEVARVIESMAEGPLVTLTGVGGVGKTRLALEVARREQDCFSDGVATCELPPLEHGAAVSHAVATALHLQQQPGLGIKGIGDRIPAVPRGASGRRQLRACRGSGRQTAGADHPALPESGGAGDQSPTTCDRRRADCGGSAADRRRCHPLVC
ncbi:AfsR/SARP family transcriptional regulator [Mycobacterium ostraviense]|uniref:AfsR/SARP family transcriptional regulator n=1 Tax=Mycobacterium ostraviense TaxID=2738409 RepID=UPI001F21B9C7|nr:AfsR/SARP family transcriptional regulator [Mycobacterium ostraviense]